MVNHLIRNFLPSQVRGVYRFDDTFSQVDGVSYHQFAENKLRFLPCSLIEPIRCCVEFDEDFGSVVNQVSLNLGNAGINGRILSYFQRHPYFHNVLHGDVEGAINYLEVQFVKKILAPLLNSNSLAAVRPQKQVGPYQVDFAFEGPTRLALEVDGFGKFDHRQDLDKFIERQNYITCQGWRVIRFTYGQIMHTPKLTMKILYNALASDKNCSNFLVNGAVGGSQSRQANLFDLTPEASRQYNVFDIVNGFYRVQDWFAEFAIENQTSEFVLQDDLGLPFPLLGLSLSSLYHFLDAVSKLLDVEFHLPRVKVRAPTMSNSWRDYFHPSISTDRRKASSGGIAVTSDEIRRFSSFLPSPTHREEHISFRSGLSLEEIHHSIGYIAGEVFGYSDGTNRFQDKVLQRIFDGKETLGISTTGSGKSFCFWLPALLKPGLTLVIAPLKSLMRDQRLTLLNYGIASMEFINSDVKAIEQRRYMQEAKLGYLRLIYISPERLRIRKFMEELKGLQEVVPVNMLAIDEAHCISEWGHDFRPSYLKLPSIRSNLTKGNIGSSLLALTATAGQQVEKDMRTILKLTETDVVREQMADRERFSYQIIPVRDGSIKTDVYHKVLEKDLPVSLKEETLKALLNHCNNRQEKSVGLVFCIYANPHGKNTIFDGTSHYLFQTIDILEPDMVFMARRGRQTYPKYNLDGFGEGKARAFSSKSPTLCPFCHSYAYSSHGNTDVELDVLDVQADRQPGPSGNRLKICQRCGHVFQDSNVRSWTTKKWDTLIKQNQDDFKHSRFDILVATKGFGMGIDKSSVRFVIHTSLPSGIESWYQEVGRAGRDNERAHIVLLVDTPTHSCRKDLEGKDLKRPDCSWAGGCRHGRNSICDYGKQHLFITGSYPGAESDAIYALRMLDRILSAHIQTGESPVPVPFGYSDEISKPELALYRLLSLGLIGDYAVAYDRSPRFEVALTFRNLPVRAEEMHTLESRMQACLANYMSHLDNAGKSQHTLTSIRMEYRPLGDFRERTNKFHLLADLDPASFQYSFFNIVYEYLLLILDHIYKQVVTMRYDMLWNLYSMVRSEEDGLCQRVRILPYFEGIESVDETYRCGCCNVCSRELDFPDRVVPRQQNISIESSTIELNELLRDNILDIATLRRICDVFREYRTATYAKGRAVLEGNPNNLPALYLTREFSPPAELAANTRRFLRTANERGVQLVQIKELYKTCATNLKSEILLQLNSQNTACDCPEGWEFLVEEANMPQHYENEQIAALGDCLEFFLLVEKLPPGTERFKKKSLSLEEIIHA